MTRVLQLPFVSSPWEAIRPSDDASAMTALRIDALGGVAARQRLQEEAARSGIDLSRSQPDDQPERNEARAIAEGWAKEMGA